MGAGRVAFLLVAMARLGLPASDDVPFPGPCHPPCAQPVFVVTRSLNANELVYQANLTPEGFHPRVPVQVYWVMKAKAGEREELTNLERNRAYGLQFLEIGPHQVRFTVKALEGVVFRATATETPEGVKVRTHATFDGEEMPVDRVFISSTGSLIPKVRHIDFSGRLDPPEHAAAEAPPGNGAPPNGSPGPETVVHRYVPKNASRAPDETAGGR